MIDAIVVLRSEQRSGRNWTVVQRRQRQPEEASDAEGVVQVRRRQEVVAHAGRGRRPAARTATRRTAAGAARAVVVVFARGGALDVDFDSVGVLDVLDEPPGRVEAGLARAAHVVARLWNKENRLYFCDFCGKNRSWRSPLQQLVGGGRGRGTESNFGVHIAAVAICMRPHVGAPLPPPPRQNNNTVKIGMKNCSDIYVGNSRRGCAVRAPTGKRSRSDPGAPQTTTRKHG